MTKNTTHPRGQQLAQYHSVERSNALSVALIGIIGSKTFFSELSDILDKFTPSESFIIFLYRKDSAPIILACNAGKLKYETGLDNYINYTYVINPVYRAYQKGLSSGVYLISDLVGGDNKNIISLANFDIRIENSELIGYRTPGWPKNYAECITFINIPNGSAIDISFLTKRDGRQTTECRARMEETLPILCGVLAKQFEIDENSFNPAENNPGQEDKFQDFGSDTLTAREQEVVQLVLVGHSSNAISLKLGISLTTVKTHRRNIYTKLQISSQAELFNLFLLYLK